MSGKCERSRKLESWRRSRDSRRPADSVLALRIGAPEQTSPPDHPFRPAGAPELLCGGAVVIAEQTAQSLTTSHLPVRTADAFFRFEQRVPEPLMVALSVIMMDELSDGTTQRWLTEEDHPLQALALDRQNKPFDISVQITANGGGSRMTSVPACSSKSRNSVVNFLSRSRMRNRLPRRKPSNGSVRFRPTCIMNGPSGPGVIPAMCTFREDSSMTTST